MSTVEGLNHAYTCNTQVLGLALITIGGLMLDSVNESLIDERLARLEKAKAWSPRVVSKLESHIRAGSDDALFRINPLSFATEKNIAGNAMRAAIEMRDEIATFNRDRVDRDLILKIGVHTGAAIAVTLNDRLDYFGQTVNIAARVQNLADADEIYVSHDVYDAEGVQMELAGLAIVEKLATLKGIRSNLRVYCVRPPSP